MKFIPLVLLTLLLLPKAHASMEGTLALVVIQNLEVYERYKDKHLGKERKAAGGLTDENGRITPEALKTGIELLRQVLELHEYDLRPITESVHLEKNDFLFIKLNKGPGSAKVYRVQVSTALSHHGSRKHFQHFAYNLHKFFMRVRNLIDVRNASEKDELSAQLRLNGIELDEENGWLVSSIEVEQLGVVFTDAFVEHHDRGLKGPMRKHLFCNKNWLK